MKEINAEALDHIALSRAIRAESGDVLITGCLGQRFIAAGLSERNITVKGTPGNALGAYLNGATVKICGNAQDAVGDTMNEGSIIVDGSIGDAAGYAMRGGRIFVKGNAGYRAGIHMKEYKEKVPVMVIGGHAGSFLGEYQAGGKIIVLGLDGSDAPIVGDFPCTGMHGGRMYLRSGCENVIFPDRVHVKTATEEDIADIKDIIVDYCREFGLNAEKILSSDFTVVTPDTKNPYKQMYCPN